MLNVVQHLSCVNDEDKRIATVDFEPPEKIFRTYREWKKSDIKPKMFNLSNRHKYFMKLPHEDRVKAEKILSGEESVFGSSSNQDILDLALKALKIDYEVKDVENHSLKHKVLIMKGDIDSVHVGRAENLYSKVIDYLKTMLSANVDLCKITTELNRVM